MKSGQNCLKETLNVSHLLLHRHKLSYQIILNDDTRPEDAVLKEKKVNEFLQNDLFSILMRRNKMTSSDYPQCVRTVQIAAAAETWINKFPIL